MKEVTGCKDGLKTANRRKKRNWTSRYERKGHKDKNLSDRNTRGEKSKVYK